MRIGIIGANGFLGKSLVLNFKDCDTIEITKDSYESFVGQTFDVLINSNGNSRKFWANQNPLEDFRLSTCSVYKSLFDFRCQTYVYISSLDVYKDHPYGFNKTLSEQIIKKFHENYIILRCSAIIGPNMKKGPVYDILSGNKQFLTPDSKLQFISCDEIYNVIRKIIDLKLKNKTFNLCGVGNISIEDIGKILKKNIIYNETLEQQHFNYSPTQLLKHCVLKTTQEYIKTLGEYNERMEKSV